MNNKELIKSALDALAKFHLLTTKKFATQDFKLEDIVNNQTCIYSIEEFDYLRNLIERMFTGRNENNSEKIALLIKNKEKEEFDKLNRGEYFKRLPFADGVYEFLYSYQEFIENHLSFSSLERVVIHGDFSPSNYLVDGTIIDPKLARGNPLIDYCKFLGNRHIQNELGDEDRISLLAEYFPNINRSALEKEYHLNLVHRLLGGTGHRWIDNERKIIRDYLRRTIEALKPLQPEGDYLLTKNILEYFRNTPINKLRIGVDFDDVLANSIQLKRDIAKEMFNFDLNPEYCTSWTFHKSGLSPEQYNQIKKKAYLERTSEIQENAGAKKILTKLMEEGHEIYIITSRSDDTSVQAQRWLLEHNFTFNRFINTNEKKKASVCRRYALDIMIDDNYTELKHLDTEQTRGFLLSSLPNKELEVEPCFTRIESWLELYNQLKAILI